MAGYKEKIKRPGLVLAWGLYDLANQFFAMNIVSLYFVRWVTIEKGLPEIFYSAAFGISTLMVAVSAPVLGAVSDITGKKQPFLWYFTVLSVIFTVLLGAGNNVFLGLLFFVAANYGCQAATIFYNAQIADVAPKGRIGFISGFGRMLGYSGAIMALYLMRPLVLEKGYQAAFIPTGILFMAFALPCLVFVRDSCPKNGEKLTSFLSGGRMAGMFRQFRADFLDLYRSPGIADFFKAVFFVLCAVNVIIIFMAVYATKVLALDEIQVIDLIAFSTVFAVVGSVISGYVSDRAGAVRSLMAIFGLWVLCFTVAAFMTAPGLYRITGSLVGLALGAVWVVLRALAVKLVPARKIGRAFGMFNIVSYLSGAVGAIFWGVALFFLSRMGETGYRIAVFGLNGFMVPAFIFLLRIKKGPSGSVFSERRL